MRERHIHSVPLPRSQVRCDWETLNQDYAAIDIEIGCGVGLHPIRYAQQHPDRYLIAIEHTKERYSKFEGRLKSHSDFANLCPVHDDAISWIYHNVQPGSIDRILILYPNPYPLAKHLNRRWHAMPFMETLKKILKPDGLLNLATNEAWYADEAKEMLRAKGWRLIGERLLRQQDKPDHQPRTHFEKKYLEAGQECMDLLFMVV